MNINTRGVSPGKHREQCLNREMHLWRHLGLDAIVGILILASNPEVTLSQLLPDRTLGAESSVITPDILIRGIMSDRIEGGAVRGGHLFHSFQEFNIGEGRGVYFANPAAITHIFSRVTGSQASQLMGTLGVLGNANLYFLNPNGIVFGPNAQLDVRGSFVGSTASSFKFADGSEFRATDPQAPPLLQMSVLPGLQYGASQPSAVIVNRGRLTVGQDLTLQAANLDLQGQLQSGGDLTLQATDTVQIRDRSSQPFVAQAGGKLLLQGDRAIDIFALNHPNSGLAAGGDLVLRSANDVGGDAHYWTGGNFRIEQLDGNLGNLYSPNDPFLYVAGDVIFNGYRGASLHIVAGGQVQIPLGVQILRPDTVGEPIYPGSPTTGGLAIVTLSNGQIVTIQGNTQATLDIRAGVQLPAASNLPPPSLNPAAPATRADITIGDIRIDVPEGLVLLTNTYRPNLNLPGGNITVGPNSGILTNSLVGNGGAVFIDARDSIVINAPIDTRSSVGNSGDVTLLAKNSITINQNISSNTLGTGAAGTIRLLAPDIVIQGDRASNRFTNISANSFGAGRGGNLRIEAARLTLQDFAQLSALTGNDSRNFLPGIPPPPTTGQAGTIEINATESVNVIRRSFIVAQTNDLSTGAAGKVAIATPQFNLRDGSFISAASLGSGTGGEITVNAGIASLSGTDANGLPSAFIVDGFSTGSPGSVRVQGQQLYIQAGALVSGNAGRRVLGRDSRPGQLTVLATDLIQVSGSGPIAPSSIVFETLGTANAGDLKLATQRLLILDGGNVSAQTIDAGQAGTLEIQANDIQVIGTSSDRRFRSRLFFNSSGAGDAGQLKIQTGNLLVQAGGEISAVTANGGAGGTLELTANNVTVSGSGARGVSQISLRSTGTANAGGIRLSTNQLTLQNSGQITVEGTGTSSAGDLTVAARSLFMDNGARLTATTRAAIGGNITLKVLESIVLRRDSDIRAEATGSGNGGNITLEVGRFISAILSENSDVLAFAPQGRGGKITAKAQGIFGFRLFQGVDTPESDFVASGGSDLLNGEINIQTRNPQPLPLLPNQFADPRVVQGCQATPSASRSPVAPSQYYHTGRGGLPTSPSEALQSNRLPVPWNTMEAGSTDSTKDPTEIREAQGWVRTATGVRLVGSQLAPLPCLLGGQP